jgi:hypothetical protein
VTILGDETRAVAETVRARAWKHLAPLAASVDRSQEFSQPMWQELRWSFGR